MDDIRQKAGEKLGALHDAAKTVTGSGRDRVSAAYDQTFDAAQRLKETVQQLWQNALVVESRQRVVEWAQEAARRMREGAPPLSPALLYRELVDLFKDHLWRRSMIIFMCGAACGGGAGVLLGLHWASRAPTGPHCRALHAHPDGGVILVDDAVAAGANAGEVLVRVQACSVSPVDRAVLRGRGAALRTLTCRAPVTVGRGFSGIVLDVGPGVQELDMGDEVWGCVSEWSGGAACELLTVRRCRLSKRPRGIAADMAASVPWAGGTVLTALERLQITQENAKNKRIMVAGAGSAEGCLLIQLLSEWGAHVTVAAPANAAKKLADLGATDFVKMETANSVVSHPPTWDLLEREAAMRGPWDAAVLCAGVGAPQGRPPYAILRGSAPRSAIVDLRPHALITDRLPMPFSILFGATFSIYRLLRWMTGCGRHTDFLESKLYLSPGLERLCTMVEEEELRPVLDKVCGPQDFEGALAHACSELAIGCTVVRFP